MCTSGEVACLLCPSLSKCGFGGEFVLRWKGTRPGWVTALCSELLGWIPATHNPELEEAGRKIISCFYYSFLNVCVQLIFTSVFNIKRVLEVYLEVW